MGARAIGPTEELPAPLTDISVPGVGELEAGAGGCVLYMDFLGFRGSLFAFVLALALRFGFGLALVFGL